MRHSATGVSMASLMPTRATMSDELRVAARYADVEVSLIDFVQESSWTAVRDVGNMPIR